MSAEWFCRYLLNLQVSSCNGVVYITNHFAELSTFMADLIKDLLNDRAFPTISQVLRPERVKRKTTDMIRRSRSGQTRKAGMQK